MLRWLQCLSIAHLSVIYFVVFCEDVLKLKCLGKEIQEEEQDVHKITHKIKLLIHRHFFLFLFLPSLCYKYHALS